MIKKILPSAAQTVKFACGPVLRAQIHFSSTLCGGTRHNPEHSSPTFGASISLLLHSTCSSLGAPLRQVGFAHGPSTLVIQGAFHYYPGSSLLQAGHHPRYAEIYYYSAEQAPLRYWMNNFEKLSTSLVAGLMATVQGIQSRVNPYVSIYRPAIDIYRSGEIATRAASRTPHA